MYEHPGTHCNGACDSMQRLEACPVNRRCLMRCCKLKEQGAQQSSLRPMRMPPTSLL